MSVSRRKILGFAPFALLPMVHRPWSIVHGSTAVQGPESAARIDPAFPSQPYAIVKEMVIASHLPVCSC